jgi:hypothetical protein
VLEGEGGGRCERIHGSAKLGVAFAPHARLRGLFASMGVPHVNAEGEAEATCAAMTAAGVCDFAVSSDSDVLLFGATRVLRSLHLADRSVDSECELWEASHIEAVTGLDRDGLIAIAFLTGSDYDLRGHSADSSTGSVRSCGNGVRAIGIKQAMRTAVELQRSSQGKTLIALEALVRGEKVDASQASQVASENGRCRGCKRCGHGDVPKKLHGKRGCLQCGASDGCLPRLMEQGAVCECTYCVDVRAAGGMKRVASAHTLRRTANNAREDPSSSQGAYAVISQYKRQVHDPRPLGGSFHWRTFDENALRGHLSGVFATEAIARKLQPLHFELCLRRMASECPREQLPSLDQRRAWAVSENLKYCPMSAKRTTSESGIAPYALVDWAVASDKTCTLLALSTAARRTRLSLARKCRLLQQDSVRPSMLVAAWKQLLADCPGGSRREQESLLAWARTHNLDLVPTHATAVGNSKAKVFWKRCETGRQEPECSIIVPVDDVDTFGLQRLPNLSAVKVKHPKGQNLIPDFFASDPAPKIRDRVTTPSSASHLQSPRRHVACPMTPPRGTNPVEINVVTPTKGKRAAPSRVEEGPTVFQNAVKRRWRGGLLEQGQSSGASELAR